MTAHDVPALGRGRTLAAAAAAAAALVAAAPAADALAPDADRVAGADRFETAAEVALDAFPYGADDVVVAAGRNYPDALAASSVAGHLDGPILLVDDEVPEATLQALSQLAPSRVHIAGGAAAVDDDVADELDAEGSWTVDRFAGDDRFDTAALMAEEIGEDDAAGAAIIASGRDAADALAAGPGSFATSTPVLLTEPDELPERTAEALEAVGAVSVGVLGGENAVSDEVLAAIEQVDGVQDVARTAGEDRFATAVEVAKSSGPPDGTVLLATGFGPVNHEGERVPADALAAGPLGGTLEWPLLTVDDINGELPDVVASYLADNAEKIDRVVTIGGENAVPDKVADAAARKATAKVTALQGQVVGFGEDLSGGYLDDTFDLDDTEYKVAAEDDTTTVEIDADDKFVIDGEQATLNDFAAEVTAGDHVSVTGHDDEDATTTHELTTKVVDSGLVGNVSTSDATFEILNPITGTPVGGFDEAAGYAPFSDADIDVDAWDDSSVLAFVDDETASSGEFADNVNEGDKVTLRNGATVTIELTNAVVEGTVTDIDGAQFRIATEAGADLGDVPDDDASTRFDPLQSDVVDPAETDEDDTDRFYVDGERVSRDEFVAELTDGGDVAEGYGASYERADGEQEFRLERTAPEPVTGVVVDAVQYDDADWTLEHQLETEGEQFYIATSDGDAELVGYDDDYDLSVDGQAAFPGFFEASLSAGAVVTYQPSFGDPDDEDHVVGEVSVETSDAAAGPVIAVTTSDGAAEESDDAEDLVGYVIGGPGAEEMDATAVLVEDDLADDEFTVDGAQVSHGEFLDALHSAWDAEEQTSEATIERVDDDTVVHALTK